MERSPPYSSRLPLPPSLRRIRAILNEHNVLEEGPAEGLYETCDELAGSEACATLAKLQAAPEVAVLPHSDTPTVMSTVRRVHGESRLYPPRS